jgi:protocatechuate 3,4-dioxygenase beta subunit
LAGQTSQTTNTDPEPATIEGTVLDAKTGAPVAKARVMLLRTSGRNRTRLATVSNSGGAFRIEDVPPGDYRLWAEKNRYSHSSYGSKSPGRPGATVNVPAAGNLKEMNIELTPAAVVTGRVTDADGEALANARVQTMSFRYINGERQLSPAGPSASTDDRGEYRIFGLPPGRYYLVATDRNQSRFRRIRGDSAPPGTTIPAVYYPGSTDPSQATPIQLQIGEERTGVDFQLSESPAATVTGRVTGGSAESMGRVTVMLAPRNRNFLPSAGWTAAQVDRRTGAFEIRGVLPGSYDLRAMVRGRDQLFAREPVEVGSDDVEGITLQLLPGSTATGVVAFDAELAEGEDPSRLAVDLRARERWYGGDRARVKDGAIEFNNLAPGTYRLRVSGMPRNAYLKSATLNGQDVLATGVTVPQGGLEGLQILIGLRGATVTGIVVDEDGDPLPGATAVLLPDEGRQHREDLQKSVTTDQSGLFTFSGLPSGEYRLHAFGEIEDGAWTDPDFMEPYADSAETVEVDEGAQQVIELTADSEPAE